MKKLIYCAAALATALFAGSCQRELLDPAAQGNTVTFTVEIPEVATKATIGDEASSINDLVYAVYRTTAPDLRTTLTNWDEYTNLVYQKNPSTTVFTDHFSTTVSLELINNQNYVILFWAQKNDVWVAGENFDLTKITYPADLEGNVNMVVNRGVADKYAAFSAVRFLAANEFAGQKTVELKRPFAQINIAAKDPVNYDVVVNSSSMTVGSAGDMFNVASQDAAATKNITYTWENIPATDGYIAGGVTYDHYVAMGYVFAKDNVTVSYNINTKDHGTVTNTINHVPVAANYRTNIVGGLLTSNVDYEVTLDKVWSTPDTNIEVVSVASAKDLQEAINNIPTQNGAEGNIILEGPIDLGDLFDPSTLAVTKAGNATLPIVIPAGMTMTLDLNGFTITTPWEDETAGKHYYAFDNKGTLKIVDSKAKGKIVARGNFNYGKMTLESGTIAACDGNGGYGVRNYEGAEFVMNGGAIMTSLEDGDIPGEGYDACPIRVDEGAKAVINGGSINNISNYTCNIDNYGETIVNDGTFTSVHTTLANSASMTINGGSFTCNGLEGITAHALWAADGTTTINGGTFKGKDNYNGFNVDASKGATVYIKGGEFLPVHSGSLYGDGTIIVTGGTFFDQVPAKYLAAGYSCEENEEGKWIVPQVALAKIGEVSYPTLAAAIDDVSEDAPATITVQAAVFTDEPIVIPAGKSITLDLNGMSITGKMHKSVGHVVKNEGTLTIKNGTISSTANNGGSAVMNTGTLTVENVTLNGAPNADGSWPSYAVNNTGVATITNTTITSYHGAVASYNENALVTLNNSEIAMAGIPGFTNHGIYTYNNGSVVVNDGTYANNAKDQASTGGSVINGAVTVNAGAFTGRIENYSGTPVLKGGTYSVDPTRFVAADYKAVKNAETTMWDVVAKVYVAEVVGGEKYETLQEAVNAAQDGATIELLRNETFTETNRYNNGGWWDGLGYSGDKSFTIDLGGFTVSQNGALNDYLMWFKNDGAKANTITLKNGTMDAGTTAFCAIATSSSNKQTITINLENINLINNISNGAVAKIRGGSVLNVKAGTVITGKNSYTGIEAVGNNTVVNIYEGAEIYQNGTSSDVGAIVGASYNATLNIYGGKGKSAKCGIIVMSTGATINVSGGEWTANGDGTVSNDNAGVLVSQNNRYESGWACKSILNVTGGTFKGGYNCYGMGPGVEADDAQIKISGGNFNADPEAYLVYGYRADEVNGVYTVTVDPAAKIGSTEYATLQEAFNVGGEITLLRNITVTETVVLAEGKTVVLDLNGKTLAAADMNVVKNNGGNLTIKNGTVTRTGDEVGYSVNNASGEIAVENATIQRGLYTSGSKMTATNSNISHEQSSRHAIYAWNCEVTINSGTFHNDNAGNATLMASGSSVVTINGGTFSIADGRSSLGWTSSMIDQNSTAQVIVKGGLFNGGFRINSADTILTIEGGEFNTNNGSAFTDYSGTKVVKGGKFTDAGAQNWAKKYIADGYEMNANGEVVVK